MFPSSFPKISSLNEAEEVDKNDFDVLREYLIEQDTGLTPEELEEIMRGDSIHDVPPKKREEFLKRKKEKEREEKIERILKKEFERINEIMEEKVKEQDENFLQQLEATKGKKK